VAELNAAFVMEAKDCNASTRYNAYNGSSIYQQREREEGWARIVVCVMKVIVGNMCLKYILDFI